MSMQSTLAVSHCPPPRMPYGNECITVVVGAESNQSDFLMHKDLVCASSKFFRRALAPPFIEHETGIINLPDESPEVFRAFSDWLYSGDPGKSAEDSFVGKNAGCCQMYWLKVYCFADRLLICGLQLWAWRQLKAIFSWNNCARPSGEFMYALHRNELPPSTEAVRQYVSHHIVHWHLKWRSNGILFDWTSTPFPTGNADLEAVQRIREGNRILVKVAAQVAKCDARQASFSHPSRKREFEANHGVNVVELQKAARAFDQERAVETECDNTDHNREPKTCRQGVGRNSLCRDDLCKHLEAVQVLNNKAYGNRARSPPVRRLRGGRWTR